VGSFEGHLLGLRGAGRRVVVSIALVAFLLSGFAAASHVAEHANAGVCCDGCEHPCDSAPCDGEDGHDAGDCALCRVAFHAGAPVVAFAVLAAPGPAPTPVPTRRELVDPASLDRWPPARGPPHAPPA
jgi:hypothetical protein